MQPTISNLQYITQNSCELSHAEQARLMFSKGINWVQIRMKNHSGNEITQQAKLALEYAKKYDAKLIINDSIEITKNIGAHGVHLGLKDIPVDIARKELGKDFIIGGTANTFEDIKMQITRGADYIGLGPFRFTTTKQKLSPVLGLQGYQNIKNLLDQNNFNVPIVAVGGIEMDDIESLKSVGIEGVAISGALFKKYTEN